MKPIKLKIEGVKSFTEEVMVDFEKLLSGGLFGIFGDTGSGKSSILDSIVLALYGKTSKTNQKTEFVNTKCFKAKVDFSFGIIINGERKVFNVVREFNLNKNRESKDVKATLYEVLSDGSIVMVEDGSIRVTHKIEEIIGLGIDEFEKCIALPQGQFSSFVNSDRATRIKMMGKLFDLERFGDSLARKVKGKKNQIDNDIAELSGRLTAVMDNIEVSSKELEEKYNELIKEFEESNKKYLKNKEYIDNFKEIYVLHKSLDSLSYNLEELLKDKEKFDKKEVMLLNYDVAKTISLQAEEYSLMNKNLKQKQVDFDNSSAKKNKLILDNAETESNYVKLAEMRKKLDESNLLLGQTSKYEEVYKQTLEHLRDKTKLYKDLEEVKKSLLKQKTELKKLLDLKAELTKEFEALKGLSIDEVADAFAQGKIKDVRLEELEFLVKFIEKLDDYKDNSVLHKFVSDVVFARKSNVEEKVVDVKNIDENHALQLLEEFKNLASEKDRLKGLIMEIDTDHNVVNSKISVLKDKEDEIKSNIVRCEECLKEKTEVINSFTKNVPLQDFVKNLEDEIALLKERIDHIEKRYLEFKEKQNDYDKELAVVGQEIESLEESMSNLEIKIKSSFNSNVKDTKVAREIIANFPDKIKLKEEIDGYKSQIFYLTHQKEEVLKAIHTPDYDCNKYEFALKNYEELSNILNNLKENLIIYKNNLKNARQNEEKRCIIEKDIFDLKTKSDDFGVLYGLVKAQNLMQFVADEYLSDICVVAQKTLDVLSSGRFGLCYDNDFYVLDNFDGGKRRSVASLSGGETFLVSLSLALSLSQEIYAKSHRPIEFFFLDEGFGTLDENLVETVVDSLEKLKNENFSIGVISHVAELKQRINNKIIVTGATRNKGSQIKVEY